mgnify:CR=1 FL=1
MDQYASSYQQPLLPESWRTLFVSWWFFKTTISCEPQFHWVIDPFLNGLKMRAGTPWYRISSFVHLCAEVCPTSAIGGHHLSCFSSSIKDVDTFMEMCIVAPLNQLCHNSLRPLFILVDALDECEYTPKLCLSVSGRVVEVSIHKLFRSLQLMMVTTRMAVMGAGQ